MTAAAGAQRSRHGAATGSRGGDRARGPRPAFALAVLGLSAALAVAALTALGIWQLERRVWKLELIGQVEQRAHAAPVAAPGPAAWPSMTAGGDAYRRVRLSGVFLNDLETQVQAVTEHGGGFWVLTPLRTPEGFTVLVNRGFVAAGRRDPATRMAGQIEGPTTVTGLVRMSEPGGAFLRGNDAAAGRWFSRDVGAIAAARGLARNAPYFIDADAGPGGAGQPLGGLTVIAFANNHLVYALTWFTLALMVAGAAVFVACDEWRLRASRHRIVTAAETEQPPLRRSDARA